MVSFVGPSIWTTKPDILFPHGHGIFKRLRVGGKMFHIQQMFKKLGFMFPMVIEEGMRMILPLSQSFHDLVFALACETVMLLLLDLNVEVLLLIMATPGKIK